MIITSKSGTKVVNVTKTATGAIIAMYVQVYHGIQQVLESKSFSSEKKATKWAIKKLES